MPCGIRNYPVLPRRLLAAKARGKSGAKSKRKKRRPFTPDELKAIFSYDWFAVGRGELTAAGTYREWQPYYYWLPLCGLYTGARIRELCQLLITDLRLTADGVWIFDINDLGSDDEEDPEKSLKNDQSVRRIPVHPHLIKLGLLDWHAALTAAGHTRLFPELTHDDVKGYGKAASKWFSSFLKQKMGWARDLTRTFHSFRHTLTTETTHRLNPPEHLLAQITGHKRGESVLKGTYLFDMMPGDLVKLVEKITFVLPTIAPFDVEAGMKALQDALARKRKSAP